MTGTYKPQLEWLNLEWHQAIIRAGSLCVQRCDNCGRWRLPPRRFCPECWSADATFVPVPGRGKVISYAISHRSLDPGWAAKTPFGTLVVELDEGPRVLAATTLPPEKIAMGLGVQVRTEVAGKDFARMWAEPA